MYNHACAPHFNVSDSSVSSAVNSLSAVVLEDFIKPIYSLVHKDDKEGISEKTATRLSKALCNC